MRLVAQEGREVACGGKSERHHGRILRRVDEFVELAVLESIEVADRGGRRHQARLPGRTTAERPATWRDRCLGPIDRVAGCECRVGCVRICGFVGAEGRVALEIARVRARQWNRAVRVFDPHGSSDGAAIGMASHWQ